MANAHVLRSSCYLTLVLFVFCLWSSNEHTNSFSTDYRVLLSLRLDSLSFLSRSSGLPRHFLQIGDYRFTNSLEICTLLLAVPGDSVLTLAQKTLDYERKFGTCLRCKWMLSRIPYHHNSVATFCILMVSGDIEVNPGPSKSNSSASKTAPRCVECEKPVAKNHRRCVCSTCFDFTHAKCAGIFDVKSLKSLSSSTAKEWICTRCCLNELPRLDLSNLSDTHDEEHHFALKDTHEEVHHIALKETEKQLKIMHINTQSMVSTFDSLLLTVERYSFDIVKMSETWLKANNLLLQHVAIPGYECAFNNRDKIRGGGVGVYIKDSLKYKRRTDIEKRYPIMEHLWLEIQGKNKHSKLLLGTIYRSDTIQNFTDWLDNFESLLSDLVISWDGMLLLTCDFNVDLLRSDKPATVKYMDILSSLNLTQLITTPTRTTLHSATLIDHVITNMPNRVTRSGVLPCPLISDHDAPYVCVSVRVTRFLPRYKNIRHERNFDKQAFIKDFEYLPFSLIYSTDDPDAQIEIFNSLVRDCIDQHAPLRRTKVTRPPAPWMKHLDIQELQQNCRALRTKAREENNEHVWNLYKDSRNKLKSQIRKAKRDFYHKALSSRKPKEAWKVIHRVFHPSPKPLKANPDELNEHFASTSQRITGAIPESADNLLKLVDALPTHNGVAFSLKPVTCKEVSSELNKLRSDCSCGPDGIPVKFLKLVSDHLTSPLTHILNNCIVKDTFPSSWKVARISPIPKNSKVTTNNDLRPISILPTLSKIYERLVLSQMASFMSSECVLKDTISAYRKGHNTTTVLLAMRDDILRAMKRGEVTLAVMADFSKAFDTVAFETVLKKLHQNNFSKSFLKWVTNYLTGRKQYVQIDDKESEKINVTFGVPQGSILGPVLFNLYVNDLSDMLGSVTTHQYADDTTFYAHAKPGDLKDCECQIQHSLNQLSSWSQKNNLALNPQKTKIMLLSTQQLARVHQLDEYHINLSANGQALDRTTTTRLLGTDISQHLKWNNDTNSKISGCYATLAVLRKIKHFAPFHIRKQLAESLILSKLDYNDTVTYSMPDYLVNRLQRVQFAAASFVVKHYADPSDIIKLGWLPVVERRDFHLCKLAFKALHCSYWPSYLKLEEHVPARTLRSSNERKLKVPLVTGTFQYNAAKTFNSLPIGLRNCSNLNEQIKLTKTFLSNIAVNRTS